MKYIKTFELRKQKDTIIYENEDFKIYQNSTGLKVYESKYRECGAFFIIACLIREKSQYLNDENFRNIEINDNDVKECLNNLEMDPKILGYEKLPNTKKFRSSSINCFIGDKTFCEVLPENVYINIIFRYSPIIGKSIEKSKTFGELIDKFKVIREDIRENLPYEMSMNKYNL